MGFIEDIPAPIGPFPEPVTDCRYVRDERQYRHGLRRWSEDLCQPVKMAITIVREEDEVQGVDPGYCVPLSMDRVRATSTYSEPVLLERVVGVDRIEQGQWSYRGLAAEDARRFQLVNQSTIHVHMPYSRNPTGEPLYADTLGRLDSPHYRWHVSVNANLKRVYFLLNTDTGQGIPSTDEPGSLTLRARTVPDNLEEPCRYHWGRLVVSNDGYTRLAVCSTPRGEPESYIGALNVPGGPPGEDETSAWWLGMVHSPLWTEVFFASHREICRGPGE